jgi:hypothetical protein
VVALAAVLALAPAASSARASGPLHDGPFMNSYDFIGFNCGGFDVRIEGAGTDSFTTFLDAGDLTKVIYRARYPHDTLTNTVSCGRLASMNLRSTPHSSRRSAVR